MTDHALFMRRAAELAERGRGKTAPNPCVGSVLVKDGEIVAEGWHTKYGELHAEREALADAQRKGVDPSACAMYVTLEPCNHHGKTPPCTEGILEAGVTRVYVGARDPNPVAAGGVEYLREKGIHVETGIEEQLCRDLIDDFLLFKNSDRAFLYLKMAQTLDGKIASRRGRPEAVTGPEAKKLVHGLRARTGAVIVGGGTFYADDPQLTCRLVDEGDTVQPLAVIVTSRLPETDMTFCLLRERATQTVFWTTEDAAASGKAEALRALGCRVVGLPGKDDGLDFAKGLTWLRQEAGVFYAMCEGGGRLAMSLAEQGLVDELWTLLAPRVLGDDEARQVFSGRNLDSLDKTINFRVFATRMAGEDLFIRLKPKRNR